MAHFDLDAGTATIDLDYESRKDGLFGPVRDEINTRMGKYVDEYSTPENIQANFETINELPDASFNTTRVGEGIEDDALIEQTRPNYRGMASDVYSGFSKLGGAGAETVGSLFGIDSLQEIGKGMITKGKAWQNVAENQGDYLGKASEFGTMGVAPLASTIPRSMAMAAGQGALWGKGQGLSDYDAATQGAIDASVVGVLGIAIKALSKVKGLDLNSIDSLGQLPNTVKEKFVYLGEQSSVEPEVLFQRAKQQVGTRDLDKVPSGQLIKAGAESGDAKTRGFVERASSAEPKIGGNLIREAQLRRDAVMDALPQDSVVKEIVNDNTVKAGELDLVDWPKVFEQAKLHVGPETEMYKRLEAYSKLDDVGLGKKVFNRKGNPDDLPAALKAGARSGGPMTQMLVGGLATTLEKLKDFISVDARIINRIRKTAGDGPIGAKALTDILVESGVPLQKASQAASKAVEGSFPERVTEPERDIPLIDETELDARLDGKRINKGQVDKTTDAERYSTERIINEFSDYGDELDDALQMGMDAGLSGGKLRNFVYHSLKGGDSTSGFKANMPREIIGAQAGWEQDDDGSIGYDPIKGALGAAAMGYTRMSKEDWGEGISRIGSAIADKGMGGYRPYKSLLPSNSSAFSRLEKSGDTDLLGKTALDLQQEGYSKLDVQDAIKRIAANKEGKGYNLISKGIEASKLLPKQPMKGKQLIDTLKARGVSSEELKHSGFEKWANDLEKPVFKEEVSKWWDNNAGKELPTDSTDAWDEWVATDYDTSISKAEYNENLVEGAQKAYDKVEGAMDNLDVVPYETRVKVESLLDDMEKIKRGAQGGKVTPSSLENYLENYSGLKNVAKELEDYDMAASLKLGSAFEDLQIPYIGPKNYDISYKEFPNVNKAESMGKIQDKYANLDSLKFKEGLYERFKAISPDWREMSAEESEAKSRISKRLTNIIYDIGNPVDLGRLNGTLDVYEEFLAKNNYMTPERRQQLNELRSFTKEAASKPSLKDSVSNAARQVKDSLEPGQDKLSSALDDIIKGGYNLDANAIAKVGKEAKKAFKQEITPKDLDLNDLPRTFLDLKRLAHRSQLFLSHNEELTSYADMLERDISKLADSTDDMTEGVARRALDRLQSRFNSLANKVSEEGETTAGVDYLREGSDKIKNVLNEYKDTKDLAYDTSAMDQLKSLTNDYLDQAIYGSGHVGTTEPMYLRTSIHERGGKKRLVVQEPQSDAFAAGDKFRLKASDRMPFSKDWLEKDIEDSFMKAFNEGADEVVFPLSKADSKTDIFEIGGKELELPIEGPPKRGSDKSFRDYVGDTSRPFIGKGKKTQSATTPIYYNKMVVDNIVSKAKKLGLEDAISYETVGNTKSLVVDMSKFKETPTFSIYGRPGQFK